MKVPNIRCSDIPLPARLIRLDGIVLDINESFIALLSQMTGQGLTAETIVGRKCFEIAGNARACEGCVLSSLIDEPGRISPTQPTVLERTYPTLGFCTLRVFCQPIRSENGHSEAVLEFLLDVTQDRNFRQFFELMSDAIFVIDVETLRFVEANGRAMERVGCSKQQLLAMTLPEVDPNFPPAVSQELAEQIRKNGPKTFESYNVRADGSLVQVEVNCDVISFQGRPAFLAVNRDISNRKAVEQLQKEKLESQARYYALMEQSSEALALVDMETQTALEVNRKFTELFGWSLPEDAPLYVNRFIVDSQANLDRLYNKTLRRKRHMPAESRRVRHKSGIELIVERAGSVISLDGRNLFLASMRDMTEERLRQAKLSNDVEFARRVQQELLPQLHDSPQVKIRTFYHPVHFVSGDSFHLEWQNDGRLLRGFLIDVAGHGLATAIQTTAINVLLREASASGLPLLQQVQQVNSHAAKYFIDGTYAAILGFELDLSQQELRYVGAGITQFYVNGRKIETPGMFVGAWEEAEFSAGVLPVNVGDGVFFLTDGFTDVLSRPDFADFWSQGGKDFEADLAGLRQLERSGLLRDDATGVCLQVKCL